MGYLLFKNPICVHLRNQRVPYMNIGLSRSARPVHNTDMRFVLYNIRYGTGGKRLLSPLAGYLRHTQQNLDNIIGFLHELPDNYEDVLETTIWEILV